MKGLDQLQPPKRVADKLAQLQGMYQKADPISCLTAYDYPTGRLLDEAGIDLILVGDSLGMVVLGYEDTTSVTMPEMLHHTKAVARAVKDALILGDMPYCSYDTPGQALENARALIDAGAEAVKMEGGVDILPQVERVINHGIPFIGHVGMLPQHVREEGGYKKKGKTPEQAEAILQDALALQKVGASAVVLESMVPSVAETLTKELDIPTIGIGAGKKTSGQILVISDVIGSFPWFVPSFAVQRANTAEETTRAAKEYIKSVKETEPLA